MNEKTEYSILIIFIMLLPVILYFLEIIDLITYFIMLGVGFLLIYTIYNRFIQKR